MLGKHVSSILLLALPLCLVAVTSDVAASASLHSDRCDACLTMVEEFSRRYFYSIAVEREKGHATMHEDGARVKYSPLVDWHIATACDLPQYKDLYNPDFQVMCKKHLGTLEKEGSFRRPLIQKYLNDEFPDVVKNKIWACEEQLKLCEKGQVRWA